MVEQGKTTVDDRLAIGCWLRSTNIARYPIPWHQALLLAYSLQPLYPTVKVSVPLQQCISLVESLKIDTSDRLNVSTH
jgi:hypothetical protein